MLAETILRQRDTRARIFGDLREPAWTMLLDLQVQQARGRAVTISSLCIASRVPATTALRYVQDLRERGLVERRADEIDRRVVFITMTDKARERLAEFERQCGEQPSTAVPQPQLIDGLWTAPAGYAFITTSEGVRMGPISKGDKIMVPG